MKSIKVSLKFIGVVNELIYKNGLTLPGLKVANEIWTRIMNIGFWRQFTEARDGGIKMMKEILPIELLQDPKANKKELAAMLCAGSNCDSCYISLRMAGEGEKFLNLTFLFKEKKKESYKVVFTITMTTGTINWVEKDSW